MPILAFAQATRSAGGGSTGSGAGGKGKSGGDFVITKKLDKSSPLLSLAVSSGKHFPKATITMRKSGGGSTAYLKYRVLDGVRHVRPMVEAGGTPKETLTFEYGGLTVSYGRQKG